MLSMFSLNIGVGSQTANLTGRAGVQAIVNGASTVSVTFSSTIGSTNYGVVTSIKNTTDTNPIFLQVIETTKSAAGFTCTLNAPADTANYSLEWIAIQSI